MWLLRFILLLSCLSLLTPVPLLSAASDVSFAEIRDDYLVLLGSSQLQRKRHNWERLSDRFARFRKQHPEHADADDALYLLARTKHGLSRASGLQDDARAAVRAYTRLAEQYPNSNLADDALFKAAELSEEVLSDIPAAYRYYRQIVEQLPAGDMLAEARRRLAGQVTPVLGKKTSPTAATAPPVVERIRYWSSPDYTRVVLDLSRVAEFTPNLLEGKKPRLYVDVQQAELGADLSRVITVEDGLLRQIRSNRYDRDRFRVVLDLERLNNYKVFALEDPFRIVIDVKGGERPTELRAEQTELHNLPATRDDSIAGILEQVPDVVPQPLHVPQHQPDEGIRLIVVDAGHGGKDPGAIGPHKVMEKDVTLQMAKQLTERLRKEIGCKVLLTRSKDRYLSLRERTAYANQVGADLFISLHANASANRKAYGLETYFLNLAKNNQAAEVAARENGTTLEEVSNLEAILFDLMANAKINESSRLAAEIQQAMVAGLTPHYSKIKGLGVRQGPFHVLLGATMPSVLVETAFISNKREEKRLTNNKYQRRVAATIVQGVKSYAATLEQVARR